jgi:hypothetical protein
MLSLRPVATKTSSSSDPSLILELWNDRAPIGDEMYEDSDTTITVYLAYGVGWGGVTNHTSTTKASAFDVGGGNNLPWWRL